MVLPIVVNTDREIAIDKSKYDHGLEDGLFLTEDGSLGMKRKSGECFDLYGKELNVSGKMGYRCYVEGGIKGCLAVQSNMGMLSMLLFLMRI